MWKEGNPERIAVETGLDRVVWPSGAIDSRCYLRLRGIAECRGAEDDIARFLETMRYVAARVEDSETTEVTITTDDLMRDLGYSLEQAKLVTHLLDHDGRIWSSSLGSSDGSSRSFTMRGDDGLYFQDVSTLDDLFGAYKAMDEEKSAIASMRNVYGVRTTPQPSIRPPSIHGIDVSLTSRVQDVRLRALLEADLTELNSSLESGNWKCVSILAGSCSEAILLDLWMRDETLAIKEFGKAWPNNVTLAELVSKTTNRGLLSPDAADFLTVIKRWRNQIHPARAIEESAPRRESAVALNALLGLILADLGSDDVRASEV
jgi:hypothetical protein